MWYSVNCYGYMFLIVGMMVIVAAFGGESTGNNTLTITKDCSDLRSLLGSSCRLIPEDIPKNISRIILLNFNTDSLEEYMFKTKLNIIMNINYLEISNNKVLIWPLKSIQAKAFERLPNLEELHIHLDSLLTIDKGTFDGLNALKTLNLNGCTFLNPSTLQQALKPRALPSLENLFISGIRSVSLQDLFSNRTLRKLDVSKSTVIFEQILEWYKNCAGLEYLNISGASVDYNYGVFLLLESYLPKLSYLDVSYINFHFFLQILCVFEYLKVLNISGLSKTESVLNVTAEGYIFLYWKYRFIQMECFVRSAEVLEIEQNNLIYIHPNALACFENAQTINLSGNKLFVMMKDRPDQFEILFRSLNHLEVIRLSSNELTEIPPSLFESNTKLRKIDLSSNKLQTINLHVTHLDHLDVINLENNAIIVLDSASISVLDTLPNGSFVRLNSNPLDCSHCADLGFVSWLVKSQKLQYKGLTCLMSETVSFVDDALVAVQMICDKEIKLRLSIGIPAAFLAVVIIIMLIFFYRRRQSKKRCRQSDIEEIKMIIRKKEMFAVFLTYCSEDDEFVRQYVVDSFNQNLKRVIGTDRDLVCEGDRYFRLGKPVMDEISELLDRSGVLVAVLSNNYCQSVFCRNEFQQAIYKEIPIILMLKETVDPENMSPSMRDMFEKKTRVLWENENGKYKLKTTWLNVCQSVVELIDIKKLRLLNK